MRTWERPAFRWGALLAGALAWRLILFVGPQGSDDLAYSQAAWTVASGAVPADQGIHGCRIGYVGIVGLFYALFGAGSFTLVLFNLSASVAEVALARLVAREFLDDRGAWLAAILVAILPAHVYYATEAHPDLPAAAFSTLAALLVLRARKSGCAVTLLGAGLALGAAHLVKESAFLGFAALAALGGRPRMKDLACVAGFAAAVLLESLLFWVATGDPLHRLREVHALQSTLMNSDYYLQAAPTFRRLLLDVPALLLWPGDGSYLFFALLPLLGLGGALAALKRRDATLRGPVLWALGVTLLLTIWPISLSPYRPAMVAFPRIFLVVAVPMAILSASLLGRLSVKAGGVLLAATTLIAVASSLLLHSDGRRESAGARLAYPLTKELPVASDPRTIQFFRLYDGYSARRSLLTWADPAPAGPHFRVVDTHWIRNLSNWNNLQSPAGFEDPGVPPLKTERIEGRLRLRPLLLGRRERAEPDEVRIYRLP